MSDVNRDDQLKLLPFYLVCDVSISMGQNDWIHQCNEILPALVEALEKDPIICDKVRFSVVDFSDDARLVLPLCDLLTLDHLPQLELRGGTSYMAAFNLLRFQIEQDVNQLKADGYQVHRPAVFFISDGAPTDETSDWKNAFAGLTYYDKTSSQGFRMYPNVIPYALPGSDPQILQQIIHPVSPPERAMKMYMSEPGQHTRTAANAVTNMAKLMIQSVLASGAGVANGGAGGIQLPAPAAGDGVIAVAADDDLYL
jgi:uncharacterized protein YegL